jgi:hypothetical protein
VKHCASENGIFIYIYVYVHIYLFIVVLGGNTLWHLQKFLQCIKYIIHEFTSSTALPPFLEQFQQVSFFHLHTRVHSICTIFMLPCSFPTFSPSHCTIYIEMAQGNSPGNYLKQAKMSFFFLLQNWRTGGQNRSWLGKEGGKQILNAKKF